MMLELATVADMEAINRLSAQVIDLHRGWRFDIFQSSDVSYTVEILEELIQAEAIYVAKKHDAVIGYTAFWIWQTNGPCFVPRKVMSISDFCVDEHFRGEGIGSEMMNEISAIAASRGCTDLELTVYPQNDAAIAFYRGCGFGTKSLDMQKKL